MQRRGNSCSRTYYSRRFPTFLTESRLPQHETLLDSRLRFDSRVKCSR